MSKTEQHNLKVETESCCLLIDTDSKILEKCHLYLLLTAKMNIAFRLFISFHE